MQQQSDHRSFLAATALLAMTALLLLVLAPTEAAPAAERPTAASWDVIATGLANPRGLVFGPDGALYIAEGGAGGEGPCVPNPEGGDRCFGRSGAVTKVTFDDNYMPTDQARIITGIGSLAADDGSVSAGPNGVAFKGDDMYIITGFGDDPANLSDSGPLGTDVNDFAKILAAGPGDSFSVWSDLGAYEGSENPDGVVPPDTNPFDLLALPMDTRNSANAPFLAVDAGGNSLLSVDDAGVPSLVAVFPESMAEFPPHSGSMMPVQPVPTSVVVGPDGAYYVSELTGFPFPVGGAVVWRVEPGKDPQVYAEGFTNILDLAFDDDGNLYVLEMAANGLLSGDPTGAITRIAPGGQRTHIAGQGLIMPTDMTIGPDGALYVVNISVSPATGEVVRIPTFFSSHMPLVASR